MERSSRPCPAGASRVRCEHCGYDVTGLAAHPCVCPECGRLADGTGIRAYPVAPFLLRATVPPVLVVLAGIVLGAPGEPLWSVAGPGAALALVAPEAAFLWPRDDRRLGLSRALRLELRLIAWTLGLIAAVTLLLFGPALPHV